MELDTLTELAELEVRISNTEPIAVADLASFLDAIGGFVQWALWHQYRRTLTVDQLTSPAANGVRFEARIIAIVEGSFLIRLAAGQLEGEELQRYANYSQIAAVLITFMLAIQSCATAVPAVAEACKIIVKDPDATITFSAENCESVTLDRSAVTRIFGEPPLPDRRTGEFEGHHSPTRTIGKVQGPYHAAKRILAQIREKVPTGRIHIGPPAIVELLGDDSEGKIAIRSQSFESSVFVFSASEFDFKHPNGFIRVQPVYLDDWLYGVVLVDVNPT